MVAVNAVNFMDGLQRAGGRHRRRSPSWPSALAGFGAGRAPSSGHGADRGRSRGRLPALEPAGAVGSSRATPGSLFTGFLLAAWRWPARADGRGPISIYLVPFALTPLLTDVLLTLIDRARRGQGLADAHRDHLYRLWLIKTGRPHGLGATGLGADRRLCGHGPVGAGQGL